MQELEKKFYNWLMLNYYVPIKPEKIAKDFAKIAAKHYVNCDKCLELCNENAELKERIENIKYLDYKEVEKAINDNVTIPVIDYDDDGNKTQIGKELNHKNCITSICSLAIPITKEKIMKVLKNRDIYKIYSLWQMLCHYANFREKMIDKEITDFADNMVKKIASEIIGDDNENK